MGKQLVKSVEKEVEYKGVPSSNKIAMIAMHRINFSMYVQEGRTYSHVPMIVTPRKRKVVKNCELDVLHN